MRASEELAADHDPPADADTPEHEHEVAQTARRAEPLFGDRSEVRLVLDLNIGTPVDSFTQLTGDIEVRPAKVRRTTEPARVDLDETRHGDRESRDTESLFLAGFDGFAAEGSQLVQHRPWHRVAVLAQHATLETNAPAQILDADRQRVDVCFETHADDPLPHLEAEARAAHARGLGRFSCFVEESQLDELPDKARDGAARQPRFRRYPCAGHAFPGRDMPHHDTEVRSPNRAVIGGAVGGCLAERQVSVSNSFGARAN